VIGPHIDSERLLLGDYSFKAHMEALVNANADQNFAGPQPDFTHISMDTVKTVTLLEGISSHVSDRTALYCETGCDVNSEDESRFEKAVSVASKADHVILALGDQSGMTRACTCGEARDSMTLELPGVQKKLMEKILETGKPVTLIMISGRPYSLLDFEERLDAIIQAWLPGEEGGAAVADILFGGANPGGKLPVTYPAHVGQLPVYYNHKPSGQQSKWFIDYVDGPAKPLYPFGHGLSYTRFTYSDLEISREWAMTDPFIDFSFNIKNTGTRDGDEIVQLYIHDVKGSVTRPVKELKGFKRVHLRKDETRRIKAQLPVNTLAFVDKTDQKCVEPGVFRVMIGSSSEDIRLTADIHLTGEKRYDVTSMPSKDLYHILI
jgi:beta-glucosidase